MDVFASCIIRSRPVSMPPLISHHDCLCDRERHRRVSPSSFPQVLNLEPAGASSCPVLHPAAGRKPLDEDPLSADSRPRRATRPASHVRTAHGLTHELEHRPTLRHGLGQGRGRCRSGACEVLRTVERGGGASGEKPHMRPRDVYLGALLLFSFFTATSQATAQILETDYSNPPYVVGGVDQTLSPGWARDVCGGRRFLANRTPLFEWTPVFSSEVDERLVGFAGTIVEEPTISGKDLPFTHPFGTDWEFFVAPDQSYASLLAPSNGCTGFTPEGVCLNSVADNNNANAG